VKLAFIENDGQKIFRAFPEDSDEEGLLMSGAFNWCPGKLQGHDSKNCVACGAQVRGYFTTNDHIAIQFVKYADEKASHSLSVNPDLKALIEWYEKYPPPIGWRPKIYENVKPED
jgi:hypothetical protein